MKIQNKRAKFDYSILHEYEAGIVLTGSEVRAVRDGRVSLNQSYAKFLHGEIYLVNAHFNIAPQNEADATRSRKLLLHRKEIESIEHQMKAKKLTLIPLSLYTSGRFIKARIGLARARKQVEKRQILRQKDIEREIERDLKDTKN